MVFFYYKIAREADTGVHIGNPNMSKEIVSPIRKKWDGTVENNGTHNAIIPSLYRVVGSIQTALMSR